ncbi:ferritin-like domain-containing protein [Streptacidiphilus neutrinimicus]|uniref:ferritin-like domain-containing protein n=1 Tax=Streptacidiphilus neutrinimicus TaxID=105420 RepID=UPI000A70E08C|nr:ferritin-like domain-containing protein [Streptacidiphilus neutrinimicus]
MAASLRRRSLLSAGLLTALGTLTACGSSASPTTHAGHARPRPTPVDPDTAARQRIGAVMTTLLAGYDSAAHPHAELRFGLTAQAAALGITATASRSASAAAPAPAPASASASASGSPAAGVRTSDASLASGEAGLVALCSTGLQLTSPALARLLASIGAGAAQRATQLGGRLPTSETPDLSRLRPSTAELDAWQASLAAEQATVYGYGVLGALLSGGLRSQATTDYQLHRARRDALDALITSAGAAPHAGAAAYDLPFQVADASSARCLAALLEDRLAAVYANAVQAGTAGFRADAAAQLRAAAVRSVAWGAAPTPFPGLPER